METPLLVALFLAGAISVGGYFVTKSNDRIAVLPRRAARMNPSLSLDEWKRVNRRFGQGALVFGIISFAIAVLGSVLRLR